MMFHSVTNMARYMRICGAGGKPKWRDMPPGGANVQMMIMVGQERMTDVNFAGDVALMADSWLVIMTMVMEMEEVTKRFGIIISTNKIKVLYLGRDDGNSIGKTMQDIQ